MKKIGVLLMSLIICVSFLVESESAQALSKNNGLRVKGFKIQSKSHNSISLSWKKNSSSKGYIVLRSKSKNGKYKRIARIKNKNKVAVTDNNLSSNSKYYYKIRVRFSKYNSKVIAAKTTKKSKKKNKTKKSNIYMSGFRVSGVGSKYVSLSWNRNSKSKGYMIFRSTSKNGKYKQIARITNNSKTKFVDKNVSKNKKYYYKARPRFTNNYTNTIYTKTSSNTAKPPTVGVIPNVKDKNISFDRIIPYLSVRNYDDGNHLEWRRISGATEYRVYRAKSVNGSYKRIGTCNRNKLYYNDYQGKSGEVVYYKIRAVKRSGSENIYTKYTTAVQKKTMYRVFIACGHGISTDGRWDSGCSYKGNTEAGLMLPITKSMVKYLRRAGVYVYTDADKGNNKNMVHCVAWANKKKISAYTSIHCDWRFAPAGTLPLYRTSNDRKLAQALNKQVLRGTSMGTRGISRRYDLYELNKPKAPAKCIFETGSIKADLRRLSESKSNQYGKCLARGMCNYLGVYANF